MCSIGVYLVAEIIHLPAYAEAADAMHNPQEDAALQALRLPLAALLLGSLVYVQTSFQILVWKATQWLLECSGMRASNTACMCLHCAGTGTCSILAQWSIPALLQHACRFRSHDMDGLMAHDSWLAMQLSNTSIWLVYDLVGC